MPVSESLTIRPAETGDLDTLAVLLVELQTHHVKLQPQNPRYHVDKRRWREVAAEGLEEGRSHAFVAEVGGAVVGFVKLAFADKPWGLSCEIDTLVVTRKWRGKGIGQALMEKAEAIGADHGARGYRVDVLADNYDGREFYERAGYEIFAVRYGKPVRD